VDGPTEGFLVWRLATRWRVAVDRALAVHGLTHAQYVVLASLLDLRSAGVRPTQRELADHTGLEVLYVSKLARALDGAGWVARVPDAQDGRAVRLELTRSGRTVVDRAVPVVRELVDDLLEPLGPRREGFADALRELLAVPFERERSS
jgi:MarR family transcriptional regulator, organic hydroperoxide resistance regulator